MSLLLDALKKAEEAKLQAGASAGTGDPLHPALPAGGAELSLEPVAKLAPETPETSVAAMPKLAAHLDALDAELAATPTTPPLRKSAAAAAPRQTRTAHADPAAKREAVRNVFSAKRTPTPNRTPLWIALAGVGLLAIGIGGWFVWQLQSVSGGSLASRPTPFLPPSAAAPVSTPSPAPSPMPAPTPSPAAIPAAAPAQVAQPFSAQTTPPPNTLPPESESSAPPERAERAPKASRPSRDPEGPVRITRGELRINPTLANAYVQLQADDLNAAEKSYGQVLQSDPKNTDALLGMAAIAQRKGQSADAENWYVRALEADPKDVNAQAGLINLRGQADPAAAESRLKSLLASQPGSPALNFALGNLYAGQRRWPDAQLAYFNAHTADPANPDYLFNLAASLDNMHMPKLALEYYQSALAAGAGRKTGFDPGQVRARILELKP